MPRKYLLVLIFCLFSISFLASTQEGHAYELIYLQGERGAQSIILSTSDGQDWLNLTPNLSDSFLPAWSPDGESLVFVVQTEDSVFELYTVVIETGIVSPLTDLAWYSSMPSYSPDGSRIAFAANQSGSVFGNFDIYLIDSDGDNLRQLTETDISETEPQWSPSANQIAYTLEDEDFNRDIGFYDLERDEAWNLTAPRIIGDWNERAPQWSLDGEWLIFLSHRDGESFLASADVKGSDYIFYLNPDGVSQLRNPVWSPDGRNILVEAIADDDNVDIYLFSANSPDYLRLTEHEAFDGEPSWSSDGEQIAFISERDGNREVYIMNADGSEQERITWTDEEESYPLWRPTGEGE